MSLRTHYEDTLCTYLYFIWLTAMRLSYKLKILIFYAYSLQYTSFVCALELSLGRSVLYILKINTIYI